MRGKKYSREVKAAAIKAYEDGKTLKEIETELGMVPSTVLRWCAAAGIARDRYERVNTPPPQVQAAVKEILNGASIPDVAERYGTPQVTVRRWMYKSEAYSTGSREKLSVAEHAFAVQAYFVEGKSCTEIADDLNRCPFYLKNFFNQKKPKRRPPKNTAPPKLSDKEIIRLRDKERLTWAELGEKLGLSIMGAKGRYERALINTRNNFQNPEKVAREHTQT